MSLMAWAYTVAAGAPADPSSAHPSLVDGIAKVIDSLAQLVTAFGSLAGLLAAAGAIIALRKGIRPPPSGGSNPPDPNDPGQGAP